ncbi:MAG: 7TM diverse intracellular signaling domain-containing protein [Chitinophagaceae bacterium]
MFRKTFLLIIVFIMMGEYCQPQPIITIKKEKEKINIGLQITVLVDSSGSLSFEEISTGSVDRRFILSNQYTPNFGSTLLPVWCRFKIQNYTNQRLVLAIDNSQIEWLDFYVSADGEQSHKSITVYQPFSQREILANKPFFWIDTPKDSVMVCYLRLKTLTGLQFPLTVYTLPALIETEQTNSTFYGIYIGIMIIMVLYNLLIYFSIKSISYLLYVLYVTFMMLTNLIDKGLAFEYLWPAIPEINHYINIFGCLTGIFAIYFSISFLRINRFAPKLYKLLNGIVICYLLTIVVIIFKQRYAGLMLAEIISVLASLTLFTAGVIIYRKGYKPALYYLFGWSVLLIGVNILILKDFNFVPYNIITSNGMIIGSAIESLLLSLALGNRINLYKKQKEKAQSKRLRSLEETREIIHKQNLLLEKKVEERTSSLKLANIEISNTLQNLKDTEAQLIQSEKMASLGELTAGIAHEIQNPLNFVNNFSEVNKELLEEMNEEIEKGNLQEAKSIAKDVIDNQEKINHHGKRADAIVKGMLQHSRSSNGVKEPTDINALCDEYLRLSYHGLRAKDKSFNATMKTDFDPSVGEINIIPQDIGRVILNILTNAFYVVNEKKHQHPELDYEPTVTIKTTSIISPSGSRSIQIKVSDNGGGIPQKIVEKIFQPFFTTKPTGQGTGLGLSLSYDIVKAHGGELKVETLSAEEAAQAGKEARPFDPVGRGEGTDFIIVLPA